MSGNILSQLSLLLHIPFSIWLFATKPRAQALALVFLTSVLFLPERIVFDAPAMPPLTKHSISPLVALIALGVMKSEKVPSSSIHRSWLIVTGIGLFATMLTNRDPLAVGRELPLAALAPWDFFAGLVSSILTFGVPFEIARRVYRDQASVVVFLRLFVIFGVIYAFLMLVEIRLSPQLNNWVYGYHQHDFAQAKRGDGFRPLVFLAHGLATAMFCLSTMLAAICLARIKEKPLPVSSGVIAVFLFVVLMISRSVGAAAYAILTLPLLWFAAPKTVLKVCSGLGFIIILMPCLRLTGLFPEESLLQWAYDFSVERGQSLQFRFDNETRLLAKWAERPWFGWGGYGRSHVFDEVGKDITVTDGQWIIVLTTAGLVGFVAQFALLIRPLWVARKASAALSDPNNRVILAGLTLILALLTLDLIPNGLFNSLPPFLAGIVVGFCEGLTQRPTVPQPNAATAPGRSYATGRPLVAREIR